MDQPEDDDLPVSVVIPTFNSHGRLRRAVASVLNQTHTNLELVIVDDGSDESLEWVRDVPDPRVRLHRLPNSGVSVARNVGVRVSSHELIAFLDQDDEWDPGKLALQVQAHRTSPDAAFYYTQFDWVGSTQVTPGAHQDITYRGLLADQHVCLSSVMVARRLYWDVGGHDPLLRIMQDWDLFLRLLASGRPAVGVPEILVHYYVHDDNASRDYWLAASERFAVLSAHERRALRGHDTESRQAIASGRSRTRELYAYQAVDAARSRWHLAGATAALPPLVHAARLDVRVAARSVVRSVAGNRSHA